MTFTVIYFEHSDSPVLNVVQAATSCPRQMLSPSISQPSTLIKASSREAPQLYEREQTPSLQPSPCSGCSSSKKWQHHGDREHNLLVSKQLLRNQCVASHSLQATSIHSLSFYVTLVAWRRITAGNHTHNEPGLYCNENAFTHEKVLSIFKLTCQHNGSRLSITLKLLPIVHTELHFFSFALVKVWVSVKLRLILSWYTVHAK